MHGGRVHVPAHVADVLPQFVDLLIGLGTLHVRELEVVLAAIDAGVALIDTADVYGEPPGAAERLVAAARATRTFTVVTKGGLVREGGAWIPDGRATHLAEAAEASRQRLGFAPDLYLLHAIDPRVPLATSVRALARLLEEGVVRAVGLSNVSRRQLEEALAIAPIAAVQVELSPREIDPVRGGLVDLCRERGIQVLAHRPLGGAKRVARLVNDPLLRAVGERLGASPAEVALAWVRALGAVPLAGATRVETARSIARAASLVLDDDARTALDAQFLGLIAGRTSGPRAATRGEVVVVMGMPGAGKTTAVGELVERGYLRMNRDLRGGTLDRLARELDVALAGGAERVVLDNTYPTRSSRAPVIAAAHRHGVAIRCRWLDTPIEEAQVNAAQRVLERLGRLPDPDELERAAKQDPNLFPPTVQFAWRRDLEPPALDEGWDSVEVVPFERRPAGGARRGLIVELDAALAAPDQLARARELGWIVVATAWRPTEEQLLRARDLVEVAACTHPGGPPACWCRKPMPGLGLALARAHDLDLAASVHVGDSAADRGFASRLGLRFVEAAAFVAGHWGASP